MINIKEFRLASKLSQEEAARRIGISQAQYSRYEADPKGIPLETWKQICTVLNVPFDKIMEFLMSGASTEAFNPGNLYGELHGKINIFIENARDLLLNDQLSEPAEIKKLESLISVLKKQKRKPKILLAGHYDSGKTRIANFLLGDNYLPVQFQPTTKMMTVIRHIDDKPAFKANSGSLWIFDLGFDIDNMDDESLCLKYGKCYQDVDELRTIGVIQEDEELGGEKYAVAFIDSDILKVCDIIDTPGSGNEDLDNNALEKLLKESSRFQDILIFASKFMGFLDKDDMEILGDLILKLPEIRTADKNYTPLNNLFILATHAYPGITNEEVSVLKNTAAKRLMRNFEDNVFRKVQNIKPEDVKNRIFTFWAETPSRHKEFFDSLVSILKDVYPKAIENSFYEFIRSSRKSGLDEYKGKISFLYDQLHKHEDARPRYENLISKDAERRDFIRKQKIIVSEKISDYKKEVSQYIFELLKERINPEYIEQTITRKFNDDRREAQKNLAIIIQQDINYLVSRKIEEVSKKFTIDSEQFFELYNNHIKSAIFENTASEAVPVSIPFDTRGAFLNGITTLSSIGAYVVWASALGNLGGYIIVAKTVGLLSALGISVGGGAAATSLISVLGGPVTIAVALSIFIGLAVKMMFGKSWKRRLAEKFIEVWEKEQLTFKLLERNNKYWDDTLLAFNTGCDNIEDEWMRMLNSLYEIANPENREKFNKKIREYENIKQFFEKMS